MNGAIIAATIPATTAATVAALVTLKQYSLTTKM